MTRLTARGALAACALALLAACGGHDDQPGPGTDYSFKAQASAYTAGLPQRPSPSALSDAERDEVRQRSRQWAAYSLSRSPATRNGVTVPPLFFGLAFTLEAAASGGTLEDLRTVFPPVSSAAVSAELQRGLQRSVTAGERTVLGTGFFDAVTLASRPAALGSLQLRGLSAEEQALSPLLRLSVADRAAGLWSLPQAQAFNATWAVLDGSRWDVNMLRFQAATRVLSGPGWSGQALDLGGGHWLLKIEPTAALSSWAADDLDHALDIAVRALDQAGPATELAWELPQVAAQATTELTDRRGMTLAQDEVLANFRKLDGGGTHLRFATEPSASMGMDSNGLGFGASQQLNFAYSPRNVNAPGTGSNSGGVISTQVTFPVPCPAATVQLRPFYLAVLQAPGGVAMLARLVQFRGSPCTTTGGVFIPAPG